MLVMCVEIGGITFIELVRRDLRFNWLKGGY